MSNSTRRRLAPYPVMCLAMLVILVALWASAGGRDGRPALALQEASDADIIYFEQCAPCHGPIGEGGVGPPLTRSELTDDETEQIVLEGRGAMPAFNVTLSIEEIEAVLSLVGRLAATDTYRNQCAPCHGPNGEGGIGPALVPGRLSFEDSLQIIAEGRGGMPAYGPTLSERELDGVTAFVEDLARVQLGAETYARECASCHGPAGEGGAGPTLVGDVILPVQIVTVISEGAGTMPGFEESLTGDELEAVTLFTMRIVAGVVVSVPEEADGAQLYADLCAACHGAEGEGGAGPGVLESDLDTEQLTAVIAEGQGSMPGFGGDLNAEELSALVDHVRSLAEDAPVTLTGEVLYAQWCAVCHGGEGEGGTGPSILGGTFGHDELANLILQGKGSMPGFADQLDTEGASLLIEFVDGLAASGDATTSTTAVLLRQTGAEMYAGQCAQCHALDGSGGLGPDVRGTALTVNEITSRIYGGHAGGMPAFEGELSGIEVREIARFVATLAPGPDTQESVWGSLWPIFAGILLVIAIGGFAVLRGSRAREDDSVADEVSTRGS